MIVIRPKCDKCGTYNMSKANDCGLDGALCEKCYQLFKRRRDDQMYDIELNVNVMNIGRNISIKTCAQGIWLTIRKNVKGLEHEFEDVLLSKKECEQLINILEYEVKNNDFIMFP